MTAGYVYCAMIEGCQEISDFGRVAEWTAVLQRWCAERPGLVAFTGQCAVHRGQVMRVQGAWAEALEEFDLARQRYAAEGRRAQSGWPTTRPARCTASEATTRPRRRRTRAPATTATTRNRDWRCSGWRRGGTQAAVAAVRRLLAEADNPVHRSRLLPSAVDVLVAAGQTDDARTLADELERVAHAFGSGALLAASAYAAGWWSWSRRPGRVAALSPQSGVAVGEGAEPVRRRAGAGADRPRPDRPRRRRVGAAGAGGARRVFDELGAAPAVADVDRLLRPDAAPDGLTPREVEVLRLVASGRSNAQIATELVLSEKTVARHLSNIFTKIDVGSRTAAAAYAYERGLA